MKRGMLVILCVLSSIYPLLSAWRHSVDVKVAGPEGSVTLRKFQPATDSESGLQQEAADFCQSISANSEDCEQNVIDLYNRIRSLPTWKNGEELAHRFAHNQATDYCNEPTQYRGFSSYDECYANVTRAIRRSKVVNAYQLSYKAEALISNNTLMPLPAGWKDGVEGNTFQCITKVQALQDIADDPRVVRICEIGFNMGHSVSHSSARFHKHTLTVTWLLIHCYLVHTDPQLARSEPDRRGVVLRHSADGVRRARRERRAPVIPRPGA